MPSTRNHERRASKGRAEDLSPTRLIPVCTRKYGRRAARLAAAATSPLALNDFASSMEDIPSPATMERASPRNATLSFPRVEDIADKYPKRLIQGPLHVTFVIQVVASNNEWLKTNHVLGPNEELSGTNSDRPLDPDEIMDDINDIMAVDEDDSKRATEEEDKMDVDVALAPMDFITEDGVYRFWNSRRNESATV
ncbi:hypothetical protein EV368DRAFT_86969 [Lentinula lateritia]|nr:hypothetical protein EV368DRAFT_86969 [Lentinula lateritia]